MGYQITRIVPAFVNDNINYPTAFRDPTVDETPVQVGSSGTLSLYGWNIVNPNGVDCFCKFYNVSSAPTVGTTTPVFTLQIPANGSVVLYGSDVVLYLTSGLYIAIVTGSADSSTGAPTTDLLVHLNYKQ